MNSINTFANASLLGQAATAAAHECLQRLARVVRRWRRQQQAADTRRQLAKLDARTLRDIGIHPSELSSLAAEAHGLAERTRTHAGLGPPWAGS